MGAGCLCEHAIGGSFRLALAASEPGLREMDPRSSRPAHIGAMDRTRRLSPPISGFDPSRPFASKWSENQSWAETGLAASSQSKRRADARRTSEKLSLLAIVTTLNALLYRYEVASSALHPETSLRYALACLPVGKE